MGRETCRRQRRQSRLHHSQLKTLAQYGRHKTHPICARIGERPLSCSASVEFASFVTPSVPPWSPLTRKHIEVRTLAVLLHTPIELIRLAAVFTPRGEDQLANISALAPTIAATSEQHDFGLVSYGKPETDMKIGFCERCVSVPRAFRFQPRKSARRVFETPDLDQLERLWEKRTARPHE